MAKAVFAIVSSADHAARVVDRLNSEGLPLDDLSVLFAEPRQSKEFASAHHTNPREVAGAANAGSMLGGSLGLLVGGATMVIPVPGLFVVAGPLLALLGAAAGAMVGSLSSRLSGLGVPPRLADGYEQRVADGEVLVAVHPQDNAHIRIAEQVLAELGAEDVYSAVEPLEERPVGRGAGI